jgi:hypothetical protein
MKIFSVAIALLCIVCTPVYAQPAINGTWRVEVAGDTWELALKLDGKRLIGLANSCSSRAGVYEIFDAEAEGNIVRFKCRSGDFRRIVSLTATITGNEAVFSWKLEWRNPGWILGEQGGQDARDPSNPLFGLAAPPQFTAKRVPDGQLAVLLNSAMRGSRYSGAANLVEKDLRVGGTLFIPEKASRLRAVIVVVRFGLGFSLEEDIVRLDWEKLSEKTESGLLFAQFSSIGPTVVTDYLPSTAQRSNSNPAVADGLSVLLKRLAQDSGHHELADVPVIFWSHSAAGDVAANFVKSYPKRTLAAIFYHGPPRYGDMKILEQIPVLLFAGGKDNQVPPTQVQNFFRHGRALSAPWTFGLDIESPHGDVPPSFPSLKKAEALMMPWITAIIKLRVGPDGKALRPVTNKAAWLGNHQTGEVRPIENFSESKADASWLPDEATARGWQALNELRK